MDGTDAALAAKLDLLLPHLDERQRRLLLGAEARLLGHGGIRRVAMAADVAEGTVSRGVAELEAGGAPLGRARREGGGRKRLVDLDPRLRPALLALVEPDMRGDPMSPLRWTTKSTRRLADELRRQGWPISADTVADILRAEGFSLQANAKTLEGSQHPDRDAQFRYLNEQARTFRDDGQPVISVDTKKKELIGAFANSGQEWHPAGQPVAVNTHDFPGAADGKAVPYGVYDTTANTGWVNVGCDHDTAAFAVASIRRWWQATGRDTYPQATRLLITADAGGSNGYRTRAWKSELAALAAETGLAITVCHLPPGTSKWNAIEHRLFCHISLNWRGRPLTSHEVVVNTIAATTTRAGLRVDAALDEGSYPTGVRISDAQMAALPIARHAFHGDWNYTLHPRLDQAQPDSAAQDPTDQPQALILAAWDRASLARPILTGMTADALTALTAELDALRTARQARQPPTRRSNRRVNPLRTLRIGINFRLLRNCLPPHHRAAPPTYAVARFVQVPYQSLGRCSDANNEVGAGSGGRHRGVPWPGEYGARGRDARLADRPEPTPVHRTNWPQWPSCRRPMRGRSATSTRSSVAAARNCR